MKKRKLVKKRLVINKRQNRFWFLLTVMIVASIAGLMPVTAYEMDTISGGDEKGLGKDTPVSPEYAHKIAILSVKEISSSIEDFSEWRDASVQLSTEYYNINGKKNAYSFDVTNDGLYLGYILISASKDNYPVLEFSRGRIPGAPASPSTISGAQLYGEKYISSDPKYIYLGATFYYAEYNIKDRKGNFIEKITVDLTDQSVVDRDALFPKNSAEDKDWELIGKKSANRLWNSIDEILAANDGTLSETTRSDLSYLTISTRSSSGYVYGVPYYLRATMGTHGCTPTAAGMVLAFWKTHGFPNLPLVSGGYNLIDELAVAMGTDSNGATTKGNVVGGIRTVFNNHGYGSSAIGVAGDWLWVSWEECKNEIDNGRPFMLGLCMGGIPRGGEDAYNHHTVTGVGYTTISSENYVIVHDGYTPASDRYLAFGNWWWGTWLYTVWDS